MMLTRRRSLIALAAALVAPAAVVPVAQAATTVALPPTQTVHAPRALATSGDDAVAVWSAGGAYGDPLSVVVDHVRGGAGGPSRTLGGEVLRDVAQTSTGLDLLLLRPADADGTRPARLRVLHAGFDGQDRTRWSATAPAIVQAALGTGTRGRTAVVFSTGDPYRGQERLFFSGSPDGRRFGRPYELRGALDRRRDVLLQGLDVTFDRRAGALVAFTESTGPGRFAALRTLRATPGGRAGDLRRRSGITGAVELHTTPAGRVGLLIENGRPQPGDCSNADTGPRTIWAAAAEPGAGRLPAPQRLYASPNSCYVAQARLIARGERLGVVWSPLAATSAGPGQTLSVLASTAAPGQAFTAPAPAVAGASLGAAAFEPSGAVRFDVFAPAATPGAPTVPAAATWTPGAPPAAATPTGAPVAATLLAPSGGGIARLAATSAAPSARTLTLP